MRSRHASILLTPAAARATHFWRALLILIRLQETTRFARCILTFSQQHAHWLIEFDASLSGLGIVIYCIDNEGAEVPVGGGISRL